MLPIVGINIAASFHDSTAQNSKTSLICEELAISRNVHDWHVNAVDKNDFAEMRNDPGGWCAIVGDLAAKQNV